MRSFRMLVWLACAASASCELTEIVVADAEDVVVAEFVLIADRLEQVGILHRTRGTDASREPVDDARIEIISADGERLRFHAEIPQRCLERWHDDELTRTACYVSDPAARPFVRASERYELRIELPDGRVLTGATTVPDAFTITRPTLRSCTYPADSTLTITWTRSPAAWVYVAETELHGIQDALADRGVDLEQDPLRLFGLSISNSDTSIVFPAEFGVFDRFDPNLTEALAAIQGGLPPFVLADISIGAADRNYVNWERGGIFNPSGFVRVPSVFGDGTGVFGSVVERAFHLATPVQAGAPHC